MAARQTSDKDGFAYIAEVTEVVDDGIGRLDVTILDHVGLRSRGCGTSRGSGLGAGAEEAQHS